jgi:hypothetical protein
MVTEIYCNRCKAIVLVPDLTDSEKELVLSSISESRKLMAIQQVKKHGDLKLIDAKCLINHLAESRGSCHKCSYANIEKGVSVCPQCKSVNIDWWV